jgi:hypothetical protein
MAAEGLNRAYAVSRGEPPPRPIQSRPLQWSIMLTFTGAAIGGFLGGRLVALFVL